MTIVIADTSPLNYLILVGAIDVLPAIYHQVIVPLAVIEELRHPAAPERVRAWANKLPPWITIKSPATVLTEIAMLGPGEIHAIALACETGRSIILLDDRAARRVAADKELVVTGTLGVLELAAEKGLIDLRHVLRLLLKTSFHIQPKAVADALERFDRKRDI